MEILVQLLISLITLLGSLGISIYVSKHEFDRMKNDEAFEKLYNSFWVLRDSIHQGCAYDFSDLSYEDQERIISLLINTYCYQTEEMRDLVYVLKTNRLEDFYGRNEDNIKSCNEAYNKLTEIICDEYSRFLEKR